MKNITSEENMENFKSSRNAQYFKVVEENGSDMINGKPIHNGDLIEILFDDESTLQRIASVNRVAIKENDKEKYVRLTSFMYSAQGNSRIKILLEGLHARFVSKVKQ